MEEMQIDFVNKKSAERVSSLIDQLKDSFLKCNKVEIKSNSASLLDQVESDPIKILKVQKEIRFKYHTQRNEMKNSPLAPLKQLAYSYPPTVDKDIIANLEKPLNKEKFDFLKETREEHHRLIGVLEDRLAFDYSMQESNKYNSPFVSASKLLIKEANIPLHNAKPSSDSDSGKYASILKTTQSVAGEKLQRQMQLARMIQDREQFHNDYEAKKERRATSEFRVMFPYPFLYETKS